jgi:hypothetical protein
MRGVRGFRNDNRNCPLARATGRSRLLVEGFTPAEQDFVKRFDAGFYPDLDCGLRLK